MPTYDNSTIDAAEASDALRGLAHASRVFDQPAEMYGVIGDLSSAMRSLHQVLEQIATNHQNRAAFAFNDDGNHEAGVRDALTAADEAPTLAYVTGMATTPPDTADGGANTVVIKSAVVEPPTSVTPEAISGATLAPWSDVVEQA